MATPLFTENRGPKEDTARLASLKVVRIGQMFAEGGGSDGRSEIDDHADTCVVGKETALMTHDWGQKVRVVGHDDTVSGDTSIHDTVSAVVACDHPATGVACMLVIHQAMLIPQMKHNLICPMQLRDNGLRVNDEPKHVVAEPAEAHDAINDSDGR